MFVEINGTIKVEDLIRGMIIQSRATMPAWCWPKALPAREEQFVELMNAAGQEAWA